MEKHADLSNPHQSVMLHEAIDHLISDVSSNERVFVDATFGAGGHTKSILSRIGADDRLISIDCDDVAADIAKTIANKNFTFVHRNYADISDVLASLNINSVHGFLFDLGVSSMQLDTSDRGFSFQKEAALDMRMDHRLPQTAADWLVASSEKEIFYSLRTYGEEPEAKRLARAIYNDRNELKTTLQLAALVKRVKRKSTPIGKHPATRVFQAIRISVNNELDNLRLGLAAAQQALAVGGRLVVIAFNSLEDRIVKQLGIGTAYPGFGRIYNNQLKPLGKMQRPTQDEVKNNVRARSACVRVFIKTEAV